MHTISNGIGAHTKRYQHELSWVVCGAIHRAWCVVVAGVQAIHSVGDSLATFLRQTFPAPLAATIGVDPTFQVVSSDQLAADNVDFSPGVTLYFYRATVNEQVRNAWIANRRSMSLPLPLDLHLLITVWAGTALAELTILGWVMRQLHQHPLFDGARLTPDGGWRPEEVVHVIPAELSNEDLMRIWDALTPAYRLSVSYIARVIQLDPDTTTGDTPVISHQFNLQPVGEDDA